MELDLIIEWGMKVLEFENIYTRIGIEGFIIERTRIKPHLCKLILGWYH